ncbi:hypothetical protein ERD32_02065 [Lactobacillus crispatus]|uniref:Uncharacterized protein n=1 Tax=Lactobacillus crispatus TaxID=47770 RepID=A0A4Q0LWE6_9LACO|nr:hypothetical protein [Lactobacillus crispatus]RXF59503.1 hypothetical protein ERD32_02065 [Lactobacillus crispatus]
MPLPVGQLGQKKELGNGTIGSLKDYSIYTVTAGTDINYGLALDVKDGQAVVATKTPIYGISVKRAYVIGHDFDAIEGDHWLKGEKMGALRQGSVSVPITEDVDRLDQATINVDGTFRPAKPGEQVVGRFITAGNANSTAIVDVNLTDMGTTGTGTTADNSATPAAGTTTTDTGSDKKGDK